ncbi:hypothetical protein C8R45DRAFT_937652 [Mycena sanguinolenta]|nr:hypothetical protein C8R45DRAFT_942735 [Mycena sanguinolenta]KAJ6470033.1 hypothetical protein C8R45DRAFT_937652 [Mycena sanguinolenta]
MTTDVDLPDRAELGDEVFEKFVAAQETIFDLNMIVVDAVLIWRTWAVYQGRIRAIAIPGVLLLTAFVFALIDITCNFAEGQLAETTCHPPSGLIVWSFSVGTNVVCTAFIGWKAWQHRKVLVGLGHQMMGLYPTLIIVIVNFRRTIWEERPITGDRTFPNSLRWAVNTNRSEATRKFNGCPEVGIHLKTGGKVMSRDSRIDKQPPAEEI